uniref:hypothetical protein n=1 Tax=Photorhabdus bodei TaxID=2029681 RepID=UPI001389B64D
PGCVYYAFRPQSQALIGFLSARPHNVYQRCVGQWWRIIGRSLELAILILKKIDRLINSTANLYFIPTYQQIYPHMASWMKIYRASRKRFRYNSVVKIIKRFYLTTLKCYCSAHFLCPDIVGSSQ